MLRDNGGVYGFDFGGVTETATNVAAAFGGYVGANVVDNAVTYLKDNPKTSGAVWVGSSIALNLLFPQVAQNNMLRSATIGAGVFGMKRLNQGYAFLKGVNGLNFSDNYATRMARAQAVATRQAQGLPQGDNGLEAAATPARNTNTPQGATQGVSIRLAA